MITCYASDIAYPSLSFLNTFYLPLLFEKKSQV